jgi:hypothetical protein
LTKGENQIFHFSYKLNFFSMKAKKTSWKFRVLEFYSHQQIASKTLKSEFKSFSNKVKN